MNNGEENTNLESRIVGTISRVFRIPAESIPLTASMDALPAWDSMGHMELIVSIEKEFGVTFPTYRLPDLVSIAAIAEALREHGVGGGTR